MRDSERIERERESKHEQMRRQSETLGNIEGQMKDNKMSGIS